MRLLTLGAALASAALFTSCLPAPQAFDPVKLPNAADLGARNAGTEWWDVPGYLPDSGLAFHGAQFKVSYQGVPYHAARGGDGDLRGGTLNFVEERVQRASFAFPPLRVQQGDWRLVQVAASRVGADGVAREVPGISMTPGRVWRSPSGRDYVLGWTVNAPGLSLPLDAVRDDQELLSKTTSVAYWEGAVRGAGTADGQPITAEGMGEFVGSGLTREEGGFALPGNR